MPISGNAQPFSREQPKKVRKPRFAHVENTKYGMGDHYGTGIKAPVGKIRDGIGQVEVNKKDLKKPPKSLA